MSNAAALAARDSGIVRSADNSFFSKSNQAGAKDSTGKAEFTAGKMMTAQQSSLHAPDSMGFDFSYGDASYEAAMEASGQGMLGYTGYEGKDYETDKFDIDDRLDDIKFLHGPYVERSPAGGWPMKYALLGEMNPTMASVIGTTTGYGAHYEKETKDEVVDKYQTASVPDSAKDQWAMAPVPESRSVGAFYKGPQKVVEPPRRVPPPTRYQSYTPAPKKPDPPMDCSMRPNRDMESTKNPDPAWGYSGHEFAHRYDNGDEDLSMASRISRRRQQAIERRFSASPYAHQLAQDVLKLGDGVDPDPNMNSYGWGAFPPQGL